MLDENGMWYTEVAPDGKELITIGTPEFPAQLWGPEQRGCKGSKVPWHWHEELELNRVVDGVERITVDGKSFRLEPGQGVFVNTGVMHGSEPEEGCAEFWHDSLVFDSSLVGGASGSVFWQKYLAPVLNAPECRCVPLLGETEWEREILGQIERIANVWRKKGYEFEVRDALSRVIFLLAENCVHHIEAPSERELRDAERIKQMVDFIRYHRKELITTEEIAASASISVSECLRCFRRMMNLTPKEYLRQHRVRHAVQLLTQTNFSIARIGEECGFEDMSYFARVFRTEKGCTPSEYRARMEQGS